MNARQDDDGRIEQAIPEDVWESAEQGAAGAAVSIWTGERVIRNLRYGDIHRITEFATEARLLSVVPVFDSLQVELRGSPDEDGNGQ